MAKKPKCLIEGCKSLSKARGLCGNHYQSAANLVRKDKVAWDELEKHGLATEASRNTSGFLGLLEAARGTSKKPVNGVKIAKKKPVKKKAKKPAAVAAQAQASEPRGGMGDIPGEF